MTLSFCERNYDYQSTKWLLRPILYDGCKSKYVSHGHSRFILLGFLVIRQTEKHAEQQNELVNYNTMHNNINNYMIMITLLKCK